MRPRVELGSAVEPVPTVLQGSSNVIEKVVAGRYLHESHLGDSQSTKQVASVLKSPAVPLQE